MKHLKNSACIIIASLCWQKHNATRWNLLLGNRSEGKDAWPWIGTALWQPLVSQGSEQHRATPYQCSKLAATHNSGWTFNFLHICLLQIYTLKNCQRHQLLLFSSTQELMFIFSMVNNPFIDTKILFLFVLKPCISFSQYTSTILELHTVSQLFLQYPSAILFLVTNMYQSTITKGLDNSSSSKRYLWVNEFPQHSL